MSSSSAPQLLFDDGSRIMQEHHKSSSTVSPNGRCQNNPRGMHSIREYYEINRLVKEIQSLRKTATTAWKNRIALQFPDEMLVDAPEVCWEFEKDFSSSSETSEPSALVFCLGDTTYQPCCPDFVAAAHLDADVLIHFGHACLSAVSTTSIPVLYSFGLAEVHSHALVNEVMATLDESEDEKAPMGLLLLYQVCFAHQIESLAQLLLEATGKEVICGRIPFAKIAKSSRDCRRDACCNSQIHEGKSAENQEAKIAATENELSIDLDSSLATEDLVLGGLEIPKEKDWSSFAVLFVGEDTSRQYMNIVLRFLSASLVPSYFWTWRPESMEFSKTLSPQFQRQLNRRFYLVQKARLASIFGILVANLSDNRMPSIVAFLRNLIERYNRSSYTFAVGKINPAKLANFAEIDCFVLLACPEHSLLEDERDFSVPVLTPLELGIALGLTEWGEHAYSLDSNVLLNLHASSLGEKANSLDMLDDTPYFNSVTGQYEERIHVKSDEEQNLTLLPGQGKLTTYNSAAAGFLKQREYQGMRADLGETEVRPAVAGEKGIASNYGK